MATGWNKNLSREPRNLLAVNSWMRVDALAGTTASVSLLSSPDPRARTDSRRCTLDRRHRKCIAWPHRTVGVRNAYRTNGFVERRVRTLREGGARVGLASFTRNDLIRRAQWAEDWANAVGSYSPNWPEESHAE